MSLPRMTAATLESIANAQKAHRKKYGKVPGRCEPRKHDFWHDEFASCWQVYRFVCMRCGYAIVAGATCVEQKD